MSIWDDAANYISEPFDKLAHGDIGGLSDLWKRFTPAGIIYDKIDNVSKRHVHVANFTEMPIKVLVSANSDWAYADLFTAAVSFVATCGVNAPAGWAAMKNAMTLSQFYQASRYYRGYAGLATSIYNLVGKKGTEIEPGQCVDVVQRSNSNPLNYLDPSQYGALCDASDFTLMIMRKDDSLAIFNTNSDTSWIAYPPGYCRAKYGTVDQPDDGPHSWDVKTI